VEAYKNKEVRPFPEDGGQGGQTQDEILEEKREVGTLDCGIELLSPRLC